MWPFHSVVIVDACVNYGSTGVANVGQRTLHGHPGEWLAEVPIDTGIDDSVAFFIASTHVSFDAEST